MMKHLHGTRNDHLLCKKVSSSGGACGPGGGGEWPRGGGGSRCGGPDGGACGPGGGGSRCGGPGGGGWGSGGGWPGW
ncbi:hypothetical protein Peur_068612 [Populus x canadensis]